MGVLVAGGGWLSEPGATYPQTLCAGRRRSGGLAQNAIDFDHGLGHGEQKSGDSTDFIRALTAILGPRVGCGGQFLDPPRRLRDPSGADRKRRAAQLMGDFCL